MVQLFCTLVTAIYFAIDSEFFASLYGGLVSLANAYIVDRQINTKEVTTASISARASVVAMGLSVILRMTMLAVLVVMGLLSLKLNPQALIITLVIGQVGFLIDRFIYLNKIK